MKGADRGKDRRNQEKGVVGGAQKQQKKMHYQSLFNALCTYTHQEAN